MTDKQKDVEIKVDGKPARYRIGRFTPNVGSWIAFVLMTNVLPAIFSKGLNAPKNGRAISEEDFAAVQNHCFRICSRFNGAGLPEPIMMEDGRWIDKDLESDLVGTIALTVQVLQFNISPFFEDDGLKASMTTASGLNPSKS
jgi:hypothetical protein